MKPKIKNVYVDALSQVTYVVMAHGLLSDGQLFKSIRLEILRRGKRPPPGETVVIDAP